MSLGVIAFVTVEVGEGDLSPLASEIQRLLANAHASDFSAESSHCEFQLWGENGIDYEPLERITELLKSRVTTFSIIAQEFAERDSGFYYDTRDGG